MIRTQPLSLFLNYFYFNWSGTIFCCFLQQTGSSLYLLIQFWLCYRTIYVPYENAVNVPDIFDVSVGAGFGYSDQPPVTKSPAAVQSSYDNPISSFDAPIYDENSYTAEAVSY